MTIPVGFTPTQGTFPYTDPVTGGPGNVATIQDYQFSQPNGNEPTKWEAKFNCSQNTTYNNVTFKVIARSRPNPQYPNGQELTAKSTGLTIIKP